ncbi:peptide deformylase [Anaerobacillus sp. MEB173]|uniref:peptide deformylase n=1 Tax=Anaerobacillus sp. MEB173 TaxID=3383345 RepID=UPI003F90B988
MLTMKDIIREGNPILRQVAKEVELPPSKEDKETLEKMIEFLINSQDPEIALKYNLRSGVGIAAPQIGISKRMFAVHLPDEGEQLTAFGMYNPRIVSHSVETTSLENGEGCLSVDREVTGLVPRFSRITVKGVDMNGEEISLRLRGFPAIVFQHEIDHLNGIMFYDRIEEDDPFKKAIKL